jgi:hypothetical protein
MQELDTISEFLEMIQSKGDREYTPEQVLAVLRKRIGTPEFLLLMQLREGKTVAMTALHIGYNIFDESQGVVWLLAAKAGADVKEFWNVGSEWFKCHHVKELLANNIAYTEAKRRWLRKRGFKLHSELYRKMMN